MKWCCLDKNGSSTDQVMLTNLFLMIKVMISSTIMFIIIASGCATPARVLRAAIQLPSVTTTLTHTLNRFSMVAFPVVNSIY